MSTHNIGFYEDLTKIIFELSSNIIKYAPYFFCWNFSDRRISRLGTQIPLRDIARRSDRAVVREKLSSRFPTSSDTNQAVQPQKMTGSLKFLI